MKTILATALASCMTGVLYLASGCSTTPEEAPKEGISLTQEEIEFLKKMENPDNFSVQEDIPTLFFRLSQLLTAWEDSSLFKESKKHQRIYSNLGAMLTRRVYFNFDKIVEQLDAGPHPNRVIAASALGFSRIPENERFPQRYPEAIKTLLRTLDSNDDAIIQNALLSLKLLGDPNTPIDPILPLMTQHHDPEVRSNAALCLSVIASPEESDLVTPYVLPALKDDNPKVRNHAVNIILTMKDRNAVSPLIELMGDRYELIRANAARTLGELGDRSACGVLIDNLDHPKEIVKFHCLEALIKLTGKNYGYEKEDWADWWEDYVEEQRRGKG